MNSSKKKKKEVRKSKKDFLRVYNVIAVKELKLP